MAEGIATNAGSEATRAAVSRRQAWLLAIRPKTLGAGAAPVVIGLATAWKAGPIDALAAGCCLLTALFLQIASNLANDYGDCVSRVDTAERLGPLRVTQAGLLPPGHVKAAVAACLALGSLAGLYCVWHAGLGLLVLGMVCVVCAVLYTAGPYPLSHLGLGEAFAFVFFGPVACAGTHYALAGSVPPDVILAGAMPGTYAAATLAVNNLRDLATDAKAGKRTLAVRWGEPFARIETAALLLAASVPAALLAVVSGRLELLVLLALALPGALLAQRLLQAPISRRFNAYLAASVMLDLATAVAFVLVWCLGAWGRLKAARRSRGPGGRPRRSPRQSC